MNLEIIRNDPNKLHELLDILTDLPPPQNLTQLRIIIRFLTPLKRACPFYNILITRFKLKIQRKHFNWSNIDDIAFQHLLSQMKAHIIQWIIIPNSSPVGAA